MPGSLSDDAVRSFREHGYWFPHTVLAREEAARTAAAVLDFAASDVPQRYPDPQNQLYLLKAYLLFDWADRIAHAPALLDAVESLIGPDLLLWSAGVFWKAPRSGSFVSWHQDATHYELDDPEGAVRVWVALTPATTANGTMTFVPGGHRLGQVRHVDRWAEGELLSRGETMDVAVDERAAVPVVIGPGEASFHHLYMPHASGANASDAPRVNYVMTFVDPKVRPRVGPDSALLVRGADRHGHFEREPRTTQFFGAAALRNHRRYMAMRYAILFRGAKAPPPPPHPV
jgi:ectoine hydroxylase-related dioxygenase (phytanoyl-CoA dioxygenase family)